MRFPAFDLDSFSFWLGFVIASVLWWLVSFIRPLLPRVRDQIRQTMKAFSQRNLAGAENYLLRETIRRAQRMHLAAPLFSLNEIIITPRLLAPPLFGDSEDKDLTSVPISSQVLPYLPDWPELTSPLGAPTLTVLEALQNGSNIAIIGQPGSGKTVALAHLATQLSQPQPEIAPEESNTAPRYLPLYLHILDLDTNLEEDRDPLDNLRAAVIRLASLVAQPQITRFLQTVFDNRTSSGWKPMLLLDGLDELPEEELVLASRYLRALLRKHPEIQSVVTASSMHVDGLTRAGFIPLGIASWTAAQRVEFLERWGDIWVNQFLPEIKKMAPDANIDPLLLNNWLRYDLNGSPFEITLKVWAAYTGDLNGSSMPAMLETFIQRHLVATYRTAVDSLARQMMIKNAMSIGFDAMEEFLSGLSISEPLTALTISPENDPDGTTRSEEKPKKRKSKSKLSKEAAIVSQGERIIGILMNAGLVVRHPTGKMRFNNPIFLGYLSGPHLTPDEAAALAAHLEWSNGAQALRFLAACSPQAAWMAPALQANNKPLYRNLLAVARWLPEVPTNAEWRSYVMRQLVSIIQDETLPYGARARSAAALVGSGDPSIGKLFRQLIVSPSPIIRRIAAISCGALGLAAALNDLLEQLADSDVFVRKTACVAIGSLPGETPLNMIGEILMQSDEDLRQIAAETLALRPKDGIKLLEDAVQSNDLLARRAAVSGFVQIHEPWVRQRLDKIAIEDSQWIVRNAASHALEVFDKPTALVPRPLPAPSESPWLINFASRLGLGISPDKPATNVLLSVVRSGTIDEQVSALEYLRNESDESIFRVIYDSLYGEQMDLHEPALYALWWIALSGVKVPDPAQFGLG
jgi:HEAT repeat protein